MVDYLLVLGGGAVGAITRHLLTAAAKARTHGRFHWGTLAANSTAALILGFVIEAASRGEANTGTQALVAIGFCGALSTWSTLSLELLNFTTAREFAEGGAYLLSTLTLGLGLSFAGAGIAQALW